MPGGLSNVDNGDYGATAGGSVPGMRDRTQGSVEATLKGRVAQSPGWGGASNSFFGNILGGFINGITGFASFLFGGLSGTSGGSILDLLGALVGIRSQAELAKGAADAAKADAAGALTAAKAADGKITALAQGGVRTVYTSNFTYVPSAGTFLVGVMLYGSGGTGYGAGYLSPAGVPGGLIYAEFPVTAIPSGGVAVTIGSGGSQTTFGSLLASPNGGNKIGGQLQNSTLVSLASSVFPGVGGRSGLSSGSFGYDGETTALAAGGVGAGDRIGGNASVTGQYLCGGGGGGGGQTSTSYFGPASNGGPGGFPGGSGGGGGRNGNEAYWVGGIGAPGLCAIIEFKAAA